MKCNICFKTLDSVVGVGSCGHLFCIEDAKKVLAAGGSCPHCDAYLADGNIVELDTRPSEDRKKKLNGLTFDEIWDIAGHGIRFYIEQTRLEVEMSKQQTEQARQQLQEAHHVYKAREERYTQKLQELRGEHQKSISAVYRLEKEKKRLMQSCRDMETNLQELSREKRKLEDMYRDLETKHRTSARQSGRQIDNDHYRSPFDSDGPLGFPRKVQPLQLAPPTNPIGGLRESNPTLSDPTSHLVAMPLAVRTEAMSGQNTYGSSKLDFDGVAQPPNVTKLRYMLTQTPSKKRRQTGLDGGTVLSGGYSNSKLRQDTILTQQESGLKNPSQNLHAWCKFRV